MMTKYKKGKCNFAFNRKKVLYSLDRGDVKSAPLRS